MMKRWFVSGMLVLLSGACARAATCDAGTLAELKSCVNNQANYDLIRLTSDIACTGAACCPAGGVIALNFNVSGLPTDLVFDGQGHTITTNGLSTPQNTGCILMFMQDPDQVTVKNLTIKETGGYPGNCILSTLNPDGTTTFTDQCRPTVSVSRSSSGANPARNVVFDNVHVLNSPDIAIGVSGIDGFSLLNSSIQEAGVLGLSVGGIANPTRNLIVRDSKFYNVRANAIALMGVGIATSPVTENLIEDNLFINNHWAGAYYDFSHSKNYNGGHLYVRQISGATFQRNVLSKGKCAVCDNTEVWAFELGTAQAGTFVQNTVFDNNHVSNFLGAAFYKNVGSTIPSTVTVSNNKLVNVSKGITHPSPANVPAARISGTVDSSVNSSARNGNAAHVVYKFKVDGEGRKEAARDYSNGGLQAVFEFSATPRTAVDANPLWRCQIQSLADDFLSVSTNCENRQRLEPLGFSYEPSYPGVAPVYRCYDSAKADHFLAWNPGCGGVTQEGLMGYALDGLKRVK